MTRKHPTRQRARLLRSLYIWHRYIGLVAAVFVIVLAATGLLLNHTTELGLDSVQVSSDALLDWYGVHAPANVTAYRAGARTVMDAGGKIYLDRRLLQNTEGPLRGAVDYAGLIVIATDNRLLLLTPAGELVERLDSATGVPADIQALGVTAAGALAVHTARGDYLTDGNFSAWAAAADVDAHWSATTTLTRAQRLSLNSAYRGDGLPLERVLLDLHSGRLLGPEGVYVMDGAALLFLSLAASGIWLWIKRLLSARTHRHKSGGHDGSHATD